MNELIDKSGTFLIEKPYRWTSFDVVAKIRSLCKQTFGERLKIGHAGTLDPLATGLLIVCIGKDTKTIDKLSGLDKEYIATINISGSTLSYDLEKPIDTIFDFKTVSCEKVQQVLNLFIGMQMQVPPSFSAKWVNGDRAYNMARQGIDPQLKAHEITIYKLELLRCELPEIELRILCSKGTYIRSLVRDIGIQLTGGAYLSALRRTAIGPFKVDMAMKIEEFEEMLKKIKLASNL